MLDAIKRFMKWYGQQSPNDQYVENWLQFSWWRVSLTAFAIGFVPATMLFDELFRHFFR